VEFQETPFNYIQWRAMDIAGNGYTTSPSYRVSTDTTPLVFIEFSPPEDEWQNSSRVECWVTVWDRLGGSGADLATIEYRSYPQGEEGPAWQSVGLTGTMTRCRFSVVMVLDDGHHVVEFRGFDVVGNGPWVSPAYNVSVDTTPPRILFVSPPSDEIQPGRDVDVEAEFHEDISTLAVLGLEWRWRADGVDEWSMWHNIAVPEGETEVHSIISLHLVPGRNNSIQLRCTDVVGNTVLTDPYLVWVNSPPKAWISSPANGSVVQEGEALHLSAKG
ncbi:unnamed protein product, partial [marine sediment metagenome]